MSVHAWVNDAGQSTADVPIDVDRSASQEDPSGGKSMPRGPRGAQLWLPYPGWERDVLDVTE